VLDREGSRDCHTLATVEVVRDSESAQDCVELPDYPLEIRWATGTYIDGKAIVCGGFLDNKCHELASSSAEWRETYSLGSEYVYALRSSMIDGTWLISGGANENTDQTLLYENGLFTPGLEMPYEKDRHCQVTINDTHVFITDGYLNEPETFILDWQRQTWTVVDELPATLGDATCGLLNNPDLGPGNDIESL